MESVEGDGMNEEWVGVMDWDEWGTVLGGVREGVGMCRAREMIEGDGLWKGEGIGINERRIWDD